MVASSASKKGYAWLPCHWTCCRSFSFEGLVCSFQLASPALELYRLCTGGTTLQRLVLCYCWDRPIGQKGIPIHCMVAASPWTEGCGFLSKKAPAGLSVSALVSLAHCYCWNKLIRLAGTSDKLHGSCFCKHRRLSLTAIALELLQASLLQQGAVLLPVRMRCYEALPVGLHLVLQALARRLEERA